MHPMNPRAFIAEMAKAIDDHAGTKTSSTYASAVIGDISFGATNPDLPKIMQGIMVAFPPSPTRAAITEPPSTMKEAAAVFLNEIVDALPSDCGVESRAENLRMLAGTEIGMHFIEILMDAFISHTKAYCAERSLNEDARHLYLMLFSYVFKTVSAYTTESLKELPFRDRETLEEFAERVALLPFKNRFRP